MSRPTDDVLAGDATTSDHRRNRLRLPATIVVVVLAMAVSAGAAAAFVAGRSNAHDRGVILFAGDSNMALATSFINDSLSRGPNYDHYNDSYVPVFVTHFGAGVRYPDCYDAGPCASQDYWRRKLAATLTRVFPNAIVTNLGVNDARQPGTASTFGYSDFGRKIDYFMRSVPGKLPVLWLNLPCAIEPTDIRIGCMFVNRSLAAAPRRWRNLIIVQWATNANDHPEYIQTGDVHYTVAGFEAMSSLIASRLDPMFRMPR